MIEILCSNKLDGNMSRKYSEDGRNNRVKFFQSHDIDIKDTIYINIKNKNIIFDTNKNILEDKNQFGDFYVDADAVVTKTDKFIYCLFGDCIPLVIYDKKQELVALAHLGWQSVEANLHLKLLDYFINIYNSDINDLEFYLGPSIKKESHKININEEIKQLNRSEWKPYITKDEEYYYIDLVGYIVSTLKTSNIKIDETNTYESEMYFSHHKSWIENTPNGRFIYGVRMKRG